MKKQLLPKRSPLLLRVLNSKIIFFLLLLFSCSSFAQQWSILANEGQITSVASNYTSITVVGETPYVVYVEASSSGVGKVKKYNSATSLWEQVGGDISANISYTRIYSDKTGKLYVTFVDNANSSKLAVVTYNTTTSSWETIGGTGVYVSDGSVTHAVSSSSIRSDLAFDTNNVPYITYAERTVTGSTVQGAYVKRFNGTSWIAVGSATGLVSADTWMYGNAIALDSNNIPYVVYIKQASTGAETTGVLFVYRISSSSVWENIAIPDPVSPGTSAQTGTTGARHSTITMDSDNNPIIGFGTTLNSNKATFLRYTKSTSTWDYLGNTGTRDANRIYLVNDNAGNVYDIFHDALLNGGRSNTLRAYKRDAGTVSSFVELANNPITSPSGVGIDAAGANQTAAYTAVPTPAISNASIAVGTNTAKPYIAYTRTNSSGVVTPIVRVYSPLISTKVITNLASTSITTGGEITSIGTLTAITERGVVYGTTANPVIGTNTKVIDASGGTGNFASNISSLSSTTLYHVRSYMTDGTTTVYGNDLTFTTLANQAPVAVVDAITVAEGGTATSLNGGATSVVSNDTDAENSTLSAVLVTGPSNGTLTLNSNGTFSYTHNGSETTSDSFTYMANDGTSNSNTITVSITVTPVNDAPVAVVDAISVAEGGTATALVGGATSVLANDSDAENNALTAVLVSGPANGTLILNANGTFSYAHNGSETTSDSFTYKANDVSADSNTVTVSIAVTPVNDAPLAVAEAISVAVSGTATTLVGTATSVLSNDTDAENNTLTAVLVSGPTNGTLVLNANGTFSYTHNGSATTTDSFTYKANDGTADSNIVTVSISILTAPAPTNLSYTTPNVFTKGTAITALSPTVSGGAVVSYSVNPVLPTGLSLNITSGVISGTPTAVTANANYVVTATNTGGSTNATVAITVNDVPPLTLSYTTPNVFTKGTAITALNPTVTGGAVVTYSVAPALPAGLSLNTTSGVISGTPSAITAIANYVVTATNSGGSKTATVVITVNDVAPSALNYTTPNVYTKGTAITALSPTVSGGTVVSYSVAPALPTGLSLNTTTGVISGTPTVVTTIANYVVTATNTGGSTTKTVSITVNDIAPATLSYTTPNVFTKGIAITALNPTVTGGAVVSYSVAPVLPAGLSLNTTTGVISGTPTVVVATANYVVTATNTGGSKTATVVITVNDVVPSALSYTTPNVFTKGTAITFLNPTVSGGTVVSYSVNPALPAGLSLNPITGVVSGTPTAVTAVANYVITATNTGGSTTVTVSIKVNDIPPASLSYTTPNVYTKGVAIADLNPTVSGGAILNYSVSPVLPAGLSFNSTTGVISGMPTAITAKANYTVVASNDVGSVSSVVSITINDVAPEGLTYEVSNVFKNGRAITPLVPTVAGGPVVSYSISPSLLPGLSFDTATGVISGTPTLISHERNYVVTATNSGGSSSFELTIKALDISLKVGEAFTPNGDGINDFWVVPNVLEYPNSVVRVFNTNGVKVFHSRNYQNDWNGRNENNNQELPVGSYLYQIDLSGDGTIDAQGWLYIAK